MSIVPPLRSLVGLVSLAAALVSPAAAQTIPGTGSGTLPNSSSTDRILTTSYRITYSDGSETTADLRIPNRSAPPPGGYPVVVFVHALGANRTQAPVWQERMINNGLAVWTYDVRGQGSWRRNPSGPRLVGATLWGGREMVDLAEQLTAVSVLPPPGIVDPDRIAVAGISQGGFHAWTAALNSGGAVVDPASGLGSVFPEIKCAVALDFVPDANTQRLPGGLFGLSFLNLALLPRSPVLAIDEAVQQEVRQQVLNGVPEPLPQWRVRDFGAELSQLTVPVLHRHSWFDSVSEAGPLVEAMDLVPPSTPVRAILSTGGHATEADPLQAEYFFENADRWFCRFLKDELNGVEYEPRFAAARLPLGPSPVGAGLRWPQVGAESVISPEGVVDQVYFPGSDGDLLPAARPASNETLSNVVDPAFSVDTWLSDAALRSVSATRIAIPQQDLSYTAVLPIEREIFGKPKLHLSWAADAPVASIAVTLHATLPSGERAMLSHGGARLEGTVDVATETEVRMSPIAAVLPPGTEIELRLSNLWVASAPHLPGLYAAPTFTDFNLQVLHGALQTRLEVPMREPVPVLRADANSIDAGSPADVGLDLFAGEACAGTGYLIAIGDRPVGVGSVLGGQLLPIDQGFLFDAFAQQANSAICPQFFSVLDGTGSSSTAFRATLIGPAMMSLIGRDLRMVAIVADFANLETGVRISTPTDILIR